MSTLNNKTARLITGPTIKGHATPAWTPGPNKLDLSYWNTAKRNGMVKVWLQERLISVDLSTESRPQDLLAEKDLAECTSAELLDLAKSMPEIADAVGDEIDRRKAELAAPRKDLVGINVSEALPLIAAENSTDTLEAWAEADNRKMIAEAIDDRLGMLVLDEEE